VKNILSPKKPKLNADIEEVDGDSSDGEFDRIAALKFKAIGFMLSKILYKRTKRIIAQKKSALLIQKFTRGYRQWK
jgi:hypothetical protein